MPAVCGVKGGGNRLLRWNTGLMGLHPFGAFWHEDRQGGWTTAPSLVESLAQGSGLPVPCTPEGLAALARSLQEGHLGGAGGGVLWRWRNAFGFVDLKDGHISIPEWVLRISGCSLHVWTNILCGITYIVAATADVVQGFGLPLLFPRACGTALFPALSLTRAVLDAAKKWMGMSDRKAAEYLDRALNLACPAGPPGLPEALAAYLHDEIDRATLGHLAQMADRCDWATDLAVSAARRRMTEADIIRRRHYGLAPVGKTLAQELRGVGVLDGETAAWLEAGQYTPWGIGQIADALHRLRPGAVDPALVYTEDQAGADLRRLGYDPQRIPQMLALMRTPLTARQLRAPYLAGVVQGGAVQDALRDAGVSQADATAYLAYLQQQRRQGDWRRAGAPSAAAIARLRAERAISADTARDLRQGAGLTDAEIQIATAGDAREIAQHDRAAQVAVLREAARIQSITPEEARQRLIAYGMADDDALALVQLWGTLGSIPRKEATVAELCKWDGLGILAPGEYEERLREIGYEPVDVQRIIRVCRTEAQVKALRAAQQAAQKAAAQIERRAKEGQRMDAQARKQQLAAQAAAGRQRIAELKAMTAEERAAAKLLAAQQKAAKSPQGQGQRGQGAGGQGGGG